MSQHNKPTPKLVGHQPLLERHGKLVFDEYFEEPDGTISDWLLFSAKTAPVVVFPVTTQGMVIALNHFRYGANDWVLELPGGGINEGQSPVEAAAAELGEETGYRFEQIIELTTDGLWLDPASVRVKLFACLATNGSKLGSGPKKGKLEHCEVKPFSIDDWFRMIANGEIRDCKTSCVSMLAFGKLPQDLKSLAMDGLRSVIG